MRLVRLAVRGFRNLADPDLALPAGGVAILGDNGQGKTNLLEAIYYPVLFRSFRRAPDQDVAGFGGTGFRVEAGFEVDGQPRTVTAAYTVAGRRKAIELDRVPQSRLGDAVGQWLAVAFLPEDLELASGAAAARRLYLDRMLSLAEPGYLRNLSRYRAALAQRNAALRKDRPELARAFDQPLAAAGAAITAARQAWVEGWSARLAEELEALGERAEVTAACTGHGELSEAAAWGAALDASFARDRQRGATQCGPHRDDLRLGLAGHSLREFGSTGQHRTAAIALKLLELATLERARQRPPALLLDDVFAELDPDRQHRLGARLAGRRNRQIFVTAPRPEELPEALGLPVWRMREGRVEH